MTNETDAPVEDIDPIANYYATVTQPTTASGRPFYADQQMSRIEALWSYTIQNAFAAFEDDIKGTLSPGQARRHHGAHDGHHHRAGRRDSAGQSRLHHHRRQGGV